MVPNNAHALFARPMVTSPHAAIAIEIEAERPRRAGVLRRSPRDGGARGRPARGDALRHPAEVGAAGQRAVHRPPGAQVPVAGHGVARTVVLSEIRIESLGAISAATAEFDRGLTVLTGETGTGKTMVVTGLHLLGGARADASPGAVGRRSGRRRRPFHHNRTRRRGDRAGSTRSSIPRAPTATTTAASSPRARSAGTGRRGPTSAAAACPRSR